MFDSTLVQKSHSSADITGDGELNFFVHLVRTRRQDVMQGTLGVGPTDVVQLSLRVSHQSQHRQNVLMRDN